MVGHPEDRCSVHSPAMDNKGPYNAVAYKVTGCNGTGEIGQEKAP